MAAAGEDRAAVWTAEQLDIATVSPTMPAAMSHNCRYSRPSKSPISDRTMPMSVFSSARTLVTSVRTSATSARTPAMSAFVSARTLGIFAWTLVLDSAISAPTAALGYGDVGLGGAVATDGVADSLDEGFGQRFRGAGFAEGLDGSVRIEGKCAHVRYCTAPRAGASTSGRCRSHSRVREGRPARTVGMALPADPIHAR